MLMGTGKHSIHRRRRLLCLLGVCLLAVLSASSMALQPERTAGRMLDSVGLQGGLIAHVGCGGGELTAELGEASECVVQGLSRKPALRHKARRRVRRRGMYGRVSVRRWSGGALPYTDNLANMLVVDSDRVERAEIMRVLAPRGTAFVREGDKWQKIRKSWPGEMDEWTHFLHGSANNAVAQDEMVGPPRHMQWRAPPLWCRSHETDSSISSVVTADGRLFYILDEGPIGLKGPQFPPQWSLVARDAFNGALLWKKPMSEWGWRQWQSSWENKDWTETRGGRLISPKTVQRRLVVDGTRVYVTLGYREPVTVLDARTGEVLRELDKTGATEEILCLDNTLVLRTVPSSGNGEFRGVMAVRPEDGRVSWKKGADRVEPLTLAASDGKVVFHNSRELICLSLKDGEELWSTQTGARTNRSTVTMQDGVVLSLTPRVLHAYSAEDGSRLWKASGRRGAGAANPPDLFVIDGTVWYGGPKQSFPARDGWENLLPEGPVDTKLNKVGRDLRTGDVEKRITATNAFSSGHHFRCYRSKATERYLMWPKRGIEYIDLQGDNFARCDWVRGPCMVGVMPANGLTYAPPHQCFCYPAAKLNAFNALDSELDFESPDNSAPRLRKGPAYDDIDNSLAARPGDWPTFRHDARRSGSVPEGVAPEVKPRWSREIGGELSQATVARGRVFIADIDAHTIHCLDADDGSAAWTYTAGARIDSPPTFYRGRLLFGSADGRVYCLRASDGQLAWRFRVAPADRQVMDYNQLESAWPAHGSVFVQDGVAYCTGGRSSYLDGGIRVFGLDAETGEKLYSTRLETDHGRVAEEKGRPHDMPGVRSEVLVAGENDHIFLRQVEFSPTLERLETPRGTRLGDRKMGRHLFSTSSLLDRTWWDRAFWWYSRRWPGFYFAMNAPKTGQILAFDGKKTYAAKLFRRRNIHSPFFQPGKEKVLVYADRNEADFGLSDKARNYDKGPGFHREDEAVWKNELDVLVRGMAVAGNRVFVAGPPNIMPEGEPLAAMEGRRGGRLVALSAADGERAGGLKLEQAPIFDGLVAAQGRLYISTMPGELLCLGPGTDSE